MPSLLELQERFGAALESDDAPGHGFDVYRRAIGANYRRALAATYPVVRELLGAAEFDQAVDAFVAAHPPVSGDLNVYGDAFAAFLERRVPADDEAPGMARLEWAIDEASRAPDAESTPAGVVAALGFLEDEAVAHVVLELHPSCRLVSTKAGIYDTWCARQGADARTDLADDGEGDLLLIRREGARALVERLSRGEFTWLRALHCGERFGDALAQALECDARFDLEASLSGRVHDGTICGVEAGRYNPRHG